jgi:hypothetical protein
MLGGRGPALPQSKNTVPVYVFAVANAGVGDSTAAGDRIAVKSAEFLPVSRVAIYSGQHRAKPTLRMRNGVARVPAPTPHFFLLL